MADRVTIKIDGLKELEDALMMMAEEVATKRGAAALRKTANTFRDELKEVVPVSDGPTVRHRRLKSGEVRSYDYGHLRDNIRVQKGKPRKAHTVLYQVTAGNAFWGKFLEYGTRFMRPRPWMRPLFDRRKHALTEELKARLLREVELETRRQERKHRARMRKG